MGPFTGWPVGSSISLDKKGVLTGKHCNEGSPDMDCLHER